MPFSLMPLPVEPRRLWWRIAEAIADLARLGALIYDRLARVEQWQDAAVAALRQFASR
jgi:hypothetical protein